MFNLLYYNIYDAETKETIVSGIALDSESTIYPGQDNSDPDYALPYECELHKFYQNKSAKYKAEIQITSFQISLTDIRRLAK